MTASLIKVITKLFPIVTLSLIITACGGGAGTEDEKGGNNKPQPASSSEALSSSLVSSSVASSSSIKSSSSLKTSSSTPSSSSNQEYSRASTGEYEEPNTAPTQPTNPQFISISTRTIALGWGAAGDDNGVSSYEILRNGVHIGTTTAYTMTYEDQGLTPDTDYTYAIRAVDISGHRSPLTASLNTTTLADPTNTSAASSRSSSSRSASSTSMATTSAAASSKTSSNSSTSSIANSSFSSSTSTAIQLIWSIPTKREDGSPLELHEIEGYELRHKPRGSTFFINRVIADAATHNFSIEKASRDDTFEIAAYDRNGLYSKFVRLNPL